MGTLVVRHHVLIHNAHNRFHTRSKPILLVEVTRYFGDGERGEHLVLFGRYGNACQSGHLILQAPRESRRVPSQSKMAPLMGSSFLFIFTLKRCKGGHRIADNISGNAIAYAHPTTNTEAVRGNQQQLVLLRLVGKRLGIGL